MKGLTTSLGRCVRPGSIALVLLFSQQAFATGTAAGVTIANQAQVDYDVGGNAQELILSDPNGNSTPGLASGALATTFLVDNRVDFTLVEFGVAGATLVNPGQRAAVTTFELTNTGNSTQDYNLAVVNLVSGVVNGNTDTAEMSNLRVFADTDGTGTWTSDDKIFVDELVEDASILVFVVVDASISLVDADVGNIEVTATTHDAGGATTLGDLTTDDAASADSTTTVEVVFADDGAGSIGDGLEVAADGYLVSSATLAITKVATLISDPFNGLTNQKAIPGAVIEYVVTVANTGGEAATNVVITDVLTDITLLSDFFAGAEVEIDNGGVSTCTEEADADVCTLAGGALTVGVPEPAVGLDVAAGTSMTITFRVTIN